MENLKIEMQDGLEIKVNVTSAKDKDWIEVTYGKVKDPDFDDWVKYHKSYKRENEFYWLSTYLSIKMLKGGVIIVVFLISLYICRKNS